MKPMRLLVVLVLIAGVAAVVALFVFGDQDQVVRQESNARNQSANAAGQEPIEADSDRQESRANDSEDESDPDTRVARSALEPGSRIILVQAPDGTPVNGAEVHFLDPANLAPFDPESMNPERLLREIEQAVIRSNEQGVLAVDESTESPLCVVRSTGHATGCFAVLATVDEGTAEDAISDRARRVFRLENELGLRGRVLAADGTAVAGARIVAIPAARNEEELERSGYRNPLVGMELETDSDGSFKIEGRSPRVPWVVFCYAEGHPEVRRFVLEQESIVIRLPGQRRLEGFVGDENGAPMGGAFVGIDVRSPGSNAVQTTLANEEGMFAFDGVPLGPSEIWFRADGYAFDKVFFDDPFPDYLEFSMTPGESLHGIVVDASDEPLAGVEINVFDATIAGKLTTVTTDDDGTWIADGAHPEHFFVAELIRNGYGSITSEAIHVPGDLRTVMRRHGQIIGRVTDEEGEPVERFRLQFLFREPSAFWEWGWRNHDAWDEFHEAAGGEFTFPSRAGAVELTVEAPGFERFVLDEVHVPDGGETPPLEVVLRRGRTIDGRVVDAMGRGMGGTRITWTRKSFDGLPVRGGTLHQTATAPDGSFSLQGLPEAGFTLIIDSPTAGRRFVSDLRAADAPFEIVLQEPGSLEGIVELPWLSQSWATVRVHTPGTWHPLELFPDEQGWFASGPLAPGRYRVELVDAVYADECQIFEGTSRWVEVRSGEEAFVALSSMAKCRINGWVSAGESGVDLAGFRGIVLGADGRMVATATTESSGRFVVPGLEPGKYTVEIATHEPGVALQLRREVELSDAAPIAEVEFTAPAVTCRGEVRSASGEPLAADVLLLDGKSGEVRCRTRANDHGGYRLLGVDGEDAVLLVTAPGFAADERPHITHSIRRGELLRHVLEPEARLQLRIVDDAGNPVAGADVVAQRDESRRGALSEWDGVTFTRMAPGRWTVTATSPDHLPANPVEVVLTAGATQSQTLVLARPASLTVVVFANDGAALIDEAVQLQPLDDSGLRAPDEQATDVTGSTTFLRLRAGRYAVHVRGEARETVELEAGEGRAVEVFVEGR